MSLFIRSVTHRVLFALLLLSSGHLSRAQTIRYVRQGATGAGTSWTDASGNPQAMITASATGNQVWVAAGTYQPASGQSFSMKEGVKIYGGFPSTGNPAMTDRQWTIQTTILQGNGSQVITNNNNGLTVAALLDGFTVKGGVSVQYGGGMYNNNASPTVANCTFSGNTATSTNFRLSSPAYGGGMCNMTSSPTVVNCIFSGNSITGLGTGGFGGGFYSNSPITLTGCLFSGNKVTGMAPGSGTGFGGGIYVTGALTLINCTVAGNQASGSGSGSKGGGVYVSAALTMANSIVYGNTCATNPEVYSSTSSVIYSLIKNITTAVNGNLDGATDPLFTNPVAATSAPTTTGNYQLPLCSPAVNVGDNSKIPSSFTTDVTGASRILQSVTDMGAYENTGFTLPAAANEVNATPGDCLMGNWHHFYNPTGNKLVLAVNSANVTISSLTITGKLNDKYGAGLVNMLNTPFGISKNLYPLNRSWTVVASTAPTGNVAVRFFFNSQDSLDLAMTSSFSGQLSNLILYKVEGTDAYNTAATGYIEYSYAATADLSHYTLGYFQGLRYAEFQVSSFSSGTLALSSPVILPLRLIRFDASSTHCVANLEWVTADEKNVARFELQSSTDALSYTTATVVAASNASGEQKHQLVLPITAPDTYYRLKMIDQDGQTTYSQVLRLISNCVTDIITTYPNPAGKRVYIRGAEAGETFHLYDNTGKTVRSGIIGSSNHEVSLQDLVPGIYYMTVEKSGALIKNSKVMLVD
ncbi:MAG TPA: T9SS type A sorting domain-containing protein [Puia sp.]|nr:T9SS type A sorting domain-containing protein [Puia sp.]